MSVLNILNMLYNLHFFSSKCRLFHNATLFGFCITHILITECAKIWKKIRRQKVNVRDQVSHPYKEKDKIMVLCVCADVYLLYENSEDKWFSKQWYQEFFMHQMFLFLVYFQNVWYLPFFFKGFICYFLLPSGHETPIFRPTNWNFSYHLPSWPSPRNPTNFLEFSSVT